VLDHEDLVCASNRRETMGDDDRRPAAQEPVECVLDQDLRWPVDVRGCLVEDQDARSARSARAIEIS